MFGKSWEKEEEKAGRRSRIIPVFSQQKPLQALASGRGQGQHLHRWSGRKRRDFPAHSLPRSGGGREAAAGEALGLLGSGKAFPGSAGSLPAPKNHPRALPDDLQGVSQMKSSWDSSPRLWDYPKNPWDIPGRVGTRRGWKLLPGSRRDLAELELGCPGSPLAPMGAAPPPSMHRPRRCAAASRPKGRVISTRPR